MAKDRKDVQDEHKLTIKTVYYQNGTAIKINSAKLANNAVPRCIFYMQTDKYHAHYAEVFDESGIGELHAVITRSVKGNIKIVFKREVKEGM